MKNIDTFSIASSWQKLSSEDDLEHFFETILLPLHDMDAVDDADVFILSSQVWVGVNRNNPRKWVHLASISNLTLSGSFISERPQQGKYKRILELQ